MEIVFCTVNKILHILWNDSRLCLMVKENYLVKFEYVDFSVPLTFALETSRITKWAWSKFWEEVPRCHAVMSDQQFRLNLKIPSYQYMDPHVKDKTVSRPSYL